MVDAASNVLKPVCIQLPVGQLAVTGDSTMAAVHAAVECYAGLFGQGRWLP